MARLRPLESSEVNTTAVITPFLDMTFQLLFFFMMNYHPADLEGQMELSLPQKAEARADTPIENPKPSSEEPEPKLESEVTIVLKTQHDGTHDGEISQILVQEQGETAVPSTEALLTHLTKLREGLGNKESIKIQADSRLKWAMVVKVMDVCRKAGFKDVGFAPPADLQLGS